MSLVLGVRGGMGPAATLDFLTKLQAFTPVKQEKDHIRVIVDINPQVPDRNDPFAKPGPVLAEMAGALHGAGGLGLFQQQTHCNCSRNRNQNIKFKRQSKCCHRRRARYTQRHGAQRGGGK